MVRKAIIGGLAGLSLLVSGCATTASRGVSAVAASRAPSGERGREVAEAPENDRLSGPSVLVMNGGGTLSDSQDPIPIFPKEPSPVGGIRNPGNPGSSPLPSTNPVAACRR